MAGNEGAGVFGTRYRVPWAASVLEVFAVISAQARAYRMRTCVCPFQCLLNESPKFYTKSRMVLKQLSCYSWYHIPHRCGMLSFCRQGQERCGDFPQHCPEAIIVLFTQLVVSLSRRYVMYR